MFLSDRITQALNDPNEIFSEFLVRDIKRELAPCTNDDEFITTLRRYDKTYRATITKLGNTEFKLDAIRILMYRLSVNKTDIGHIWPDWTPTE